MNQEKKDFLSLVTPPARLGINETAWLLGFNEHDIPVLVSAGLLKPLGRPPASGSKYFATVELQNLRSDTRWMVQNSPVRAINPEAGMTMPRRYHLRCRQ